MIFCINCNADVKDDDEFYKIDDLDDSALETLSDHDCEPIEGGIICKECLEFITNSWSNDVLNENIDEDVESTEVLEVPSSPQLPENEKDALKLIEEQNGDVPSQGMKRKLLNEVPISVKTVRIEGTIPGGPSASREQNSLNADSTSVTLDCAKIICKGMEHGMDCRANESLVPESQDLDMELRPEETELTNDVKAAVQAPIWSVTPDVCVLDRPVEATNQDTNNSVCSKLVQPQPVVDVLENESVISHSSFYVSSKPSENPSSVPSGDIPKSGSRILENRSVISQTSLHKTYHISDSNPLRVPSPPPPPAWPSKRELDKIKAKLPKESGNESSRSGSSRSHKHQELASTSFHKHSEGRSSHFDRKSGPKCSVHRHSDERASGRERILDSRISQNLNRRSASHDIAKNRENDGLGSLSQPEKRFTQQNADDSRQEKDCFTEGKKKKKRTGRKRNGGRTLPDGTRLPSYKRPLPGEKRRLLITNSLQISKGTPEILPNDIDGNKPKPIESVDSYKEIESPVMVFKTAATNHEGQLLQQSDASFNLEEPHSLSHDSECAEKIQDSSFDTPEKSKSASMTPPCTKIDQLESADTALRNETESVNSRQQKELSTLFLKEDENVNALVQENFESVTCECQIGYVRSFQQNDDTSCHENPDTLNSSSQVPKETTEFKVLESYVKTLIHVHKSNISIPSYESTKEKKYFHIKSDPLDQETVHLEQFKVTPNHPEERIEQKVGVCREKSIHTKVTKNSTSQLEESMSLEQKEVRNIDQKEEVSGRQMNCTKDGMQKKKRKRGLPRNGGNRLPDGTRLPKHRRLNPGGVVKLKLLPMKSKDKSEGESELESSVDISNDTFAITKSGSIFEEGQPEEQTVDSKEDIKDNVSILDTSVAVFKESMSDDTSINSLLQQSDDPSNMDVSLEILSSDSELDEMEAKNNSDSEEISNEDNKQSNASSTIHKIEPFAENVEEKSYTENSYSSTPTSTNKILPFSDEISDTSNIPKIPSGPNKLEKISDTEKKLLIT